MFYFLKHVWCICRCDRIADECRTCAFYIKYWSTTDTKNIFGDLTKIFFSQIFKAGNALMTPLEMWISMSSARLSSYAIKNTLRSITNTGLQ